MEKLLLFLALYLPFQIALNPMEGIDLASIRVFILLLAGAWLFIALKNKTIIVKKNAQSFLIASFLFLSALSVVMARNTDWSLRKLLFLFSLFPLYFVISATVKNVGIITKIMKMLIFSGTLAASIGIIQFFAQFIVGLNAVYKFWALKVIPIFLGKSFSEAVLANPSWLVNIGGQTYLRATSVFPDPHMFSFYLGMLIPLALGVLLVSKNHKFWAAFSLISLFLADLLTFSRGGYLGLLAGTVVLVIIFWNKVRQKYKIVALGAIISMVSLLLVSGPISQRFFSIFNLKEGSNKGRIETWQKALDITFSNPALGVGVGNYPLAIKAVASYREPIYAHNTYLDIAAETGIINMLVWVALLFFATQSFFKNRKKNIVFLMGGISILIFAVHSLVETGIYSPVVLTLLIILISISSSIKDINKNEANI